LIRLNLDLDRHFALLLSIHTVATDFFNCWCEFYSVHNYNDGATDMEHICVCPKK